MSHKYLSVRELQQSDIQHIVDYWLQADDDFLIGMGVDLTKLPKRKELTEMLSGQLEKAYPEKQSYCIIWLVDGVPTGHSNINKINFGEEAFMHLHLWKSGWRKQGMGVQLIKMTLPYFFKNYKLKNLFCEPYALNPAPNKTLGKVGFTFVKKYKTIPGSLNFEQEVNRWMMSRKDFESLQ